MAINLNKVTTNPKGKLCIEKKQYELFLEKFNKTNLGKERLGESFYNYFKLDKLTDQDTLCSIFAKDGEQAKANILAVFDII